MAKTVFQIKPKLLEDMKPLPIQDFSPERILEIVNQTTEPSSQTPMDRVKKEQTRKSREVSKKNKPKPKPSAEPKKPQGRPRRDEAVKRLSSDLPVELYDKVQKEIKEHGYTLNGFLAKVLREHFAAKNGS